MKPCHVCGKPAVFHLCADCVNEYMNLLKMQAEIIEKLKKYKGQ